MTEASSELEGDAGDQKTMGWYERGQAITS